MEKLPWEPPEGPTALELEELAPVELVEGPALGLEAMLLDVWEPEGVEGDRTPDTAMTPTANTITTMIAAA